MGSWFFTVATGDPTRSGTGRVSAPADQDAKQQIADQFGLTDTMSVVLVPVDSVPTEGP